MTNNTQQIIVRVALIGLAALASIGVIVASAGTLKKMGIFSRAEEGYAPVETPQATTTEASATIRWQTRTPVVSVINYGSNPTSLNLPIFESGQASTHEMAINGLDADKTYYYRIVIKDKTFPPENEKSYEFRTLAAKSATKYPPCDAKEFERRYGATRKDRNYDALYDVNSDGTINSIDFFECIRKNPPK